MEPESIDESFKTEVASFTKTTEVTAKTSEHFYLIMKELEEAVIGNTSRKATQNLDSHLGNFKFLEKIETDVRVQNVIFLPILKASCELKSREG